jgi:hypothetical protein
MNDTHKQVTVLVDGMREAIQDFDDDKLNIERLAWNLKTRIAALRQVADDAWADELKALWNQLEVINAFFIESGRDDLTADERREISEILNELRAAIAAY